MERSRETARRRAGFTLAEVMVTVALVAILAALAVPAVAAARKNMKMTELNAAAKEIFLAAQNSLTGIAAGGGSLTAAGQAALAGGKAETLVCVENGDERMTLILPDGAIDPTVAGNYYMIVCDPSTLTVREVYYAEKELPAAGEALRANYGEGWEQARRDAYIGFYTGENVTFDHSQQLAMPEIIVDNGEKLKVTIKIDLPDGALIGDTALVVTMYKDGVDTGGWPLSGKEGESIDRVNFEKEYVLDDLEDVSRQFRNFTRNGCPIEPGDNIKITAQVRYRGAGTGWLSSKTASVITNTLFAGRNGDTVDIDCGRHLQNLQREVSGFQPGDTLKARQTADIDWTAGQPERSFTPISASMFTLEYDGLNNEIRNLTVRGSVNLGLFGDVKNGTLCNIRLVSPDIAGKDAETLGVLAGYAERTTVNNCLVYLEGEAAEQKRAITGSGQIGGLLGYAEDCVIKNCGVGLAELGSAAQGCSSLGGLVGTVKSPEGKAEITNCYAAVDQLSGKSEYTGGSIGHFSPSGGGKLTITHCYAVGNISASRRYPANDNNFINGFMTGGDKTSCTVTDSYCAMTYYDRNGSPVPGAEVNYGFAPAGTATCAYLDLGTAAKIKNEGAENKDAAVSVTYEALTQWGGAPWVRLSERDSHPYGVAGAYPFPGLSVTGTIRPIPHYGSWPLEPPIENGDYLLAYYELYQDDLGFFYYGFYYQDGGTEIDTLDMYDMPVVWDGYALLCREALTKDTKVTVVPAGKGDQGKDTDELINVGSWKIGDGTAEARTVYLIPNALFQGKDGGVDLQNFYSAVSIGAGKNQVTYYCNPWFAKTAVFADAAPASPKEAIVRTPRHLRNLGEFSQKNGANNIYPGLSYVQDTDLDYSTYLDLDENKLPDMVASGTPYAALTNTLKGIKLNGNGNVYDGKGGQILGLPVNLFEKIGQNSTVQNVTITKAAIKEEGGILAKSNSGTIDTCTVKNSTIQVTDNAGAAAGFINTNTGSGKIRDCTVVDVKIQATIASGFININEQDGIITGCTVLGSTDGATTVSGPYASGFITRNFGQIISCGVRPGGGSGKLGYPCVSITSEGGVAAGFAYENNDKILGCFAVGTVNSSGYAAGFVGTNSMEPPNNKKPTIQNTYANCETRGDAFAGGFAYNNGKQGLIENCYALKSVAADDPTTGIAAGFSTTNEGKINNCYSAAEVKGPNAGSSYGFAPRVEGVKDCYYLKKNDSVLNESGTALDYNELEDLTFNDTGWNGHTGATHPFENTGNYPFPMLNGIDHWGDWPIETDRETGIFIGLARLDKGTSWKDFTIKGYGANPNDYTVVYTMPQFEKSFTTTNDGALSSKFYLYCPSGYQDASHWTYQWVQGGAPKVITTGKPNIVLGEMVPELVFYPIDISVGHKVNFYYDGDLKFTVQLSQANGKPGDK